MTRINSYTPKEKKKISFHYECSLEGQQAQYAIYAFFVNGQNEQVFWLVLGEAKMHSTIFISIIIYDELILYTLSMYKLSRLDTDTYAKFGFQMQIQIMCHTIYIYILYQLILCILSMYKLSRLDTDTYTKFKFQMQIQIMCHTIYLYI